MDAYAHLLAPGDTATVMVTGELTRPPARFGRDERVPMRLAGGRQVDLLLPGQEGVRLLAGDLTPTLVSALERAIESLGLGDRGHDPDWVTAETLAEAEQYERALDALRGGFADEEKPAAQAS
jgi:hypothetical protein